MRERRGRGKESRVEGRACGDVVREQGGGRQRGGGRVRPACGSCPALPPVDVYPVPHRPSRRLAFGPASPPFLPVLPSPRSPPGSSPVVPLEHRRRASLRQGQQPWRIPAQRVATHGRRCQPASGSGGPVITVSCELLPAAAAAVAVTQPPTCCEQAARPAGATPRVHPARARHGTHTTPGQGRAGAAAASPLHRHRAGSGVSAAAAAGWPCRADQDPACVGVGSQGRGEGTKPKW